VSTESPYGSVGSVLRVEAPSIELVVDDGSTMKGSNHRLRYRRCILGSVVFGLKIRLRERRNREGQEYSYTHVLMLTTSK